MHVVGSRLLLSAPRALHQPRFLQYSFVKSLVCRFTVASAPLHDGSLGEHRKQPHEHHRAGRPEQSRHTIFALSSGGGTVPTAIAVIRISGESAGLALDEITRQSDGAPPKRPIPRRATRRALFDPTANAYSINPLQSTNGSRPVLDDALVLWFPKPGSFTGEDMVELHVHGGPAVIADTLNALRNLPGLREAAGGEFTQRAYLNGKLDLSAAEGIMDLVSAQTALQRQSALMLAKGGLKQLCDEWKSDIVQCLALTEALIDFAEDEPVDEDGMLWQQITAMLQSLTQDLTRAAASSRVHELIKGGLSMILVGPPNAGKSSLFNSFLRRQAAIVSSIPGTTRDILDASLTIRGLATNLADCAGVRYTDDPLEAEGVRRAIERCQLSDIRLAVIDATSLLSAPADANLATISEAGALLAVDLRDVLPCDVFGGASHNVLVLSKSDLLSSAQIQTCCHEGVAVTTWARQDPQSSSQEIQTRQLPVVLVSCKTGQGMVELLSVLENFVAEQLARFVSGIEFG